ncbi:CERS1 [Cordylochernes scorpioides]|uniref:CERS1 n=1 Tax=Cordylochernes scorpioides TaxID=51811 RepID=A0ABY6KEC4_9ARAC|nr:CERS1 [Cordylochernes scorpioides]
MFFLDRLRKDWVVQLVHHVLTILLVAVPYGIRLPGLQLIVPQYCFSRRSRSHDSYQNIESMGSGRCHTTSYLYGLIGSYRNVKSLELRNGAVYRSIVCSNSSMTFAAAWTVSLVTMASAIFDVTSQKGTASLEWRDVVFSDLSRFCLQPHDGRIRRHGGECTLLALHYFVPVVLFFHDICDVPLELAKLNVYLRERNGKVYPIHEKLGNYAFYAFVYIW